MVKYMSVAYRGTPPQIVTIDVDTGQLRVTNFPAGSGIGKASVWLESRQHLLIAGADPGWLSEYDPANGALRVIGPCPDRDFYVATVANDGKVYWGTYPGARVVKYDPATDVITDYGPCNPAHTGPQYGYTIGVDPECTHVYIGPGQAPWYLAVLTLATGTYEVYFYGDDEGGTVYTAVDNSECWYKRDPKESGAEWYTLIGGVVTLSTDPRPEFKDGWIDPAGVNFAPTTWPTLRNFEADLDDAVAVSGKPTATYRWRDVGASEWQEAETSALARTAQTIKRAYPYDASRLLCLSGSYGPVYLYNPTTQTVEFLGFPQRSLYNARKIGSKWYLSGYTAVTLEWDPSEPWTLTANTPNIWESNPRQVLGVHKYHYWTTEGPDGVLYVGVTHLRDSVGGDLGWYDPATEEVGHLRTGFERWVPHGLVTAGGMIVYSGSSLDGEDGRLFVFDPGTKEVVDTIIPLPGEGVTSAGCIVAYGNDVIGFRGNRAYRVNIETGNVAWAVTLSATAFNTLAQYDRYVEVAPDGLIYLHVGTQIQKVNPATGAQTVVRTDATPGGILWFNGTAYIQGGYWLRTV